jgi:tetratricopeptide (TPR) repeat protein
VLRYRDWRALVGLSVLFPALLFLTEFVTVWVQDPFVLYRSYLWAIGVPGLVFFAAHGPSWRVLLVAGIALGGLFTWQALDRVFSLATPEAAWTDAIEKLPRDPRSVGRWFPYLNRGTSYVDRDEFKLAVKDFAASAALGDQGMGTFNIGAVLAANGRHAQALAAFDKAEKEGYNLYNLSFQRGLSLLALGHPEEAYRQFEITIKMDPPSPTREIMLTTMGRTAMQLGKRDEAIMILERLVYVDPKNPQGRYLLAMAYVMHNDYDKAHPLLDKLIEEKPTGPAYYARALANYGLKRKAEASSDIENALRADPANPHLREWQGKIQAMP